MRYLAKVSYDGSSYSGWQIQPNVTTIQEVIEKAISLINKKETSITASGRTDTGVHALGQVFHFDSSYDLDGKVWVKAINSKLPDDIRIQEVMKTSDVFHARFDAINKTYVYKINCGEYNLFERNYIYQYNKSLNIDLLKDYSAIVEGVHDFGSFNSSSYEEMPNQVRTLISFIGKLEDNILTITIKGDGFLRHMIRVLVGTYISLCEEKITLETIKNALEHPNKEAISYKVPGMGLYLEEVEY